MAALREGNHSEQEFKADDGDRSVLFVTNMYGLTLHTQLTTGELRQSVTDMEAMFTLAAQKPQIRELP